VFLSTVAVMEALYSSVCTHTHKQTA